MTLDECLVEVVQSLKVAYAVALSRLQNLSQVPDDTVDKKCVHCSHVAIDDDVVET
jgi:hypothetical protein